MNRLQFGIYKQEGEKYYEKGKIIAVFISGLLLLGGCSLVENDLDKLEGTWSDGEGNGVVFYAPNESGDTSGDAEMITNGNAQNASYEWHESSQQIVIITTDGWGDTVYGTFDYEFLSDTELEMTMTGYKDSVGATDNYGGEPVVYEKE